MSARKKSPPIFEIERKKALKRRVRRVIFFVLLFTFLGALVYVFLFSGLFTLQAVEVRGGKAVTNDKVKAAAQKLAVRYEPLYRFLGGNNILFWQDGEFHDLPKDLVPLALVKVQKNLKERRVLIEVVERKEFVSWCENSCFWMDKEGVVFASAPEVQGAIIKTIKVNSSRTLTLGDKPLPERERQIFIKVINFLDSLNLKAVRMEIEDLRFKEMKVKIPDGPTIFFSLIVDPDFGKSVIEALKKDGTWTKVDYLDLRVRGRAYYKLK